MLMKLAGMIWKRLPRSARTRISRSVQVKFTISAAAVITNEKREVLLLDHVLRPDAGWGIPGGFIEASEQPEAALRREIYEEAGIELEDVRIDRVRTIRRHIEVIYTARGVGEAAVSSREIKALGWFDIDDLPRGMTSDQKFLVLSALRPDEYKKP